MTDFTCHFTIVCPQGALESSGSRILGADLFSRRLWHAGLRLKTLKTVFWHLHLLTEPPPAHSLPWLVGCVPTSECTELPLLSRVPWLVDNVLTPASINYFLHQSLYPGMLAVFWQLQALTKLWSPFSVPWLVGCVPTPACAHWLPP